MHKQEHSLKQLTPKCSAHRHVSDRKGETDPDWNLEKTDDRTFHGMAVLTLYHCRNSLIELLE